MDSDTAQGKIEPRLAISVTRRETLALLDLLAVACNYTSERREGLLPFYKDMKRMAARRGWCARNSGASDAVPDGPCTAADP